MRLATLILLAVVMAPAAHAGSASSGKVRRVAPVQRRAPIEERRHDALDRLFEGGGVVDLHADTAMHGLALEGKGRPGRAMRLWIAALRAVGVVHPKMRHFTRHVTADSLRLQGRGVQVFSAVTRGLPPAFSASMRLYSRLFARFSRRATESDVALWLTQAAWVYGQVERNPDLLALASDVRSTVAAVRQDKIAAQLAIEGAFPFEDSDRNIDALRRFFDDPRVDLPASFPRPTARELDRGELLPYARRLGVQYLSLNHLASSCFAGSEMRPNRDRGKGLSPMGRRLIAEASRAGIMIDLAHASRQAQRDVIALVDATRDPLPLLVSHGVFSLTGKDSWRTTLPEVLPAIRATGGVVGIIGARVHLPHGGSRKPAPVIEDIADQIDFVRSHIGIDHIALGLDGDGFVGQAHATTRDVAEAIRAELASRGYSNLDIAKVFGGNYLHTLARRDRLLRARPR